MNWLRDSEGGMISRRIGFRLNRLRWKLTGLDIFLSVIEETRIRSKFTPFFLLHGFFFFSMLFDARF